MRLNNTVELLGYYGSDKIHACSAWTSTSREITAKKEKRIPELLEMLASAGHHTPFEKSSLHFLVNTDIATHIHLLKHRIGVSINAESARYKELVEDKFMIPDDWAGIESSDDVWVESGDNWTTILKEYSELGNQLYHACIKDIEPVLGRKRAKESARFFKSYNSQISADVMFNFRSFAHFLSLRNKEDAQKEIREVASQMLELVASISGQPFKHTIKAFKL